MTTKKPMTQSDAIRIQKDADKQGGVKTGKKTFKARAQRAAKKNGGQ